MTIIIKIHEGPIKLSAPLFIGWGGHIKKIGLLFFFLSPREPIRHKDSLRCRGWEWVRVLRRFLSGFGSQEEEICLFSVIFGLELQEALLHYLVTATAALFRVDFPHVAPKNATILCLISVWRWRKRCG